MTLQELWEQVNNSKDIEYEAKAEIAEVFLYWSRNNGERLKIETVKNMSFHGLKICKKCGMQYPAKTAKQKLCIVCINLKKEEE